MKVARPNFSFAVATLFAISMLAFAQTGVNRQRPTDSPAFSLNAGTTKAALTTEPATFAGTAKPLGKGAIRSWVSFDPNGHPTAVGVTFDEAALDGLPADDPHGQHGTEYVVAMPPEASATPFDHVGINWNPHGHEPSTIYDVGHFDFHFYMINQDKRATITAQGDDLEKTRRQPSAEFVPEGYIYGPDSEIAKMGAHWVDPRSHEFHGQAFTKTMIYGSYDGQFIFVEPMITRAYLLSKPNATEPLKLPARYARSGYYPTRYSVRYDPEKKEYTVALEGMTLR
jgi:hypothetical protein